MLVDVTYLGYFSSKLRPEKVSLYQIYPTKLKFTSDKYEPTPLLAGVRMQPILGSLVVLEDVVEAVDDTEDVFVDIWPLLEA